MRYVFLSGGTDCEKRIKKKRCIRTTDRMIISMTNGRQSLTLFFFLLHAFLEEHLRFSVKP